MTIDRKINAAACKDYVSFIGSDFVEQGRRAADQMIEATGGKGEVAILLGAAGNNVTTERTKGFEDRIKEKAPGLKIVFRQTGDFAREKGQSVTENLIQSKPGIKGIYAENDEMGLGAVNALKGAGKKPGDVKIVTIDGTRNAVQSIVDGWIDGVIESNPRFGRWHSRRWTPSLRVRKWRRTSSSRTAPTPRAMRRPTWARPTEMLAVTGLCKSFPGVRALSDVDFTAQPGRCTPWSARTAPASRH